MANLTLKRGEKTKLVREYLVQSPEATKKEVMEKFHISDAMFYNTRKALAVPEKTTPPAIVKAREKLKMRLKAKKRAEDVCKIPKQVKMTLSLAEIPLLLDISTSDDAVKDLCLTLCVSKEGLAFESKSIDGTDASNGLNRMITWRNLSSLYNAHSDC